jgi:hypothetical protein
MDHLPGTATVQPVRVALREPRAWHITLTTTDTLKAGTRLYFVYLGTQRQAATLQHTFPDDDGYWQIEAPGVSIQAEWFQLVAFEIIRVWLLGDAPPGITVNLTIHDHARRREHDTGLHLTAWAAKPFPIFMRAPGSQRLLGLADTPAVSIQPGAPRYLRAYRSSVLDSGQPYAVKIAYFDDQLNPVFGLKTDLSKVCACGREQLTPQTSHAPLTVTVSPCECSEIDIEDTEWGLKARLNPCRSAGDDHLRLFWGDIHSHCYADDGIRTIDDNFIYARDAALLDFAAQSAHDTFAVYNPGSYSQYTPSMRDYAARHGYDWEQEFVEIIDTAIGCADGQPRWAYALKRAHAYNQPREFVTIPAFEWTSGRYVHLEKATHIIARHGHRCVYFSIPDPPIFPNRDARFNTPEKLFEALGPYRGQVITVPHHPASHPERGWIVDWSRYDPDFDRLVEVFSCQGGSEYPGNPYPDPGVCGPENAFVRHAIARGCKVGMVAGTDNHEARPGQMDGGWGDSPGGMIGVWARELTREAVFEALYNRHCYGVSNMSRMIVEFRINGALMGSELTLSATQGRELTITVHGTQPIREVQIIKNGKPWVFLRGGESRSHCAITDDEVPTLCDSYYVRIVQIDGEIAWTSPIWINREG